MSAYLTAICELIVKTKCGSLDVSQPYGPSRSVTGTALTLPHKGATWLIAGSQFGWWKARKFVKLKLKVLNTNFTDRSTVLKIKRKGKVVPVLN
jgi:hypothetical protein